MSDNYKEQREQEMNTQKETCPEVQEEQLFEQLKSEASLALREFERYQWQYEKPAPGCNEPTINNAMAFLGEYGVDNWTAQNLWDDILLGGPVKETTIMFMCNVITHHEIEALKKEKRNPWACI